MIQAPSSVDGNHRIWRNILRVLREQRQRQTTDLLEEYSFYIYRTDTNQILARGVLGYEAAKDKANQIRKEKDLTWNQVKFKAERRTQAPSAKKIRFGVSPDGRTYTNAYGERGRMDYSRNYNPSKGRRFRGYYDKDGNFHDID